MSAGHIATVETEHFIFEAHGLTARDATARLIATLKKHGKNYALRPGWEFSYLDGVKTREFIPGAGFRDEERIL